jgi:hypothetical protein
LGIRQYAKHRQSNRGTVCKVAEKEREIVDVPEDWIATVAA